MSYYNTTKARGDVLKEYQAKAISQDQVVMKIFEIENRPLSPSQVLNLSKLNCPLTSIRRSMTNLTNEGDLTKTGKQVSGIYGRPEYLWKLTKKVKL